MNTPLHPQTLFDALLAEGFGEFAGVPCSLLNHLIVAAERSPDVHYVPASVEGEAVAIAAGAWLAGSRAVVLMQNSGLGNAVNPLGSLAIPYRIPMLVITSWRGEPGRPDAVHHYPMGAATSGMFDLFGIHADVLSQESDLLRLVREAREAMDQERMPRAFIVPKGVFGSAAQAGARDDAARPARVRTVTQAFEGGPASSRADLVTAYLAAYGGDVAVSTTGYMSRELSSRGMSPQHFPMQGSMGFALAIALGVNRIQPERRVFVLDGDGAAIMRLGSLATAGAVATGSLVHIVADNHTYASTGGQRTVSAGVDFAGVASACGYARAGRCTGRDRLAEALAWAGASEGAGPTLLHVLMNEAESDALDRPEATPPEIATAFRAHVTGVQ